MNEKETEHESAKSTWGKIWFGKEPRSSAFPLSISTGLGLSALLSLVTANWGNYSIWWQNFVFIFISLLPITIPLMWVVLVDRSTLKGAVPNPEQSVEHMWLSQAASAAFFVTFGATGLASALATIFFGESIVGAVLMWVGLAMMVLFAISYFVAKNKG